MLAILFALFIFAAVCAVIAAASRRTSVYDDEITTTTTTTFTNGPTLDIVGNLARQWEGTQPFVIDPVDGDKVWLNTKDDMYEDGGGKVWRLA